MSLAVGNVGGTSNLTPQSMFPMSMSQHGSLPHPGADSTFEPNFRQFDFFIENKEPPNVGVLDRVYKTPEGQGHHDLRTFQYNIRCTPVLFSSIFGAVFVNMIYTRLLTRSGVSIRWAFFKSYATVLLYNNVVKAFGRERYFQRDFQRNQLYSADELRDKRDRQRVREALYAQKFVKDPVAEYRLKAWQIADRFQ